MPRSLTSGALATLAVVANSAVAVWGFLLDGDPMPWLFVGGFLPVLWAYVEVAQVRGEDPDVGNDLMDFHRHAIAFAGFMLAFLVGMRLSVRVRLLEPSWGTTAESIRWLLCGSGMVVFGNLLPTLRSPWSLEDQPFAWQRVHRFAGWTFVLGGLGVIASWVSLPPETAERSSILILASASIVAVGRKFVSIAAHSTETQ